MSLFGSLIPGLREVRAPLVAGYLWFICGWLLLEPAVPSADSNEIYERLASIGEAIGPVGLAFAASVSAYLVGSLAQSGFRLLWSRRARDFGPLRLDEDQEALFSKLAAGSGEPRGIDTILEVADPFHEAAIGRPFLDDSNLSLGIREMADRELIEAFRQLRVAVRSVQRRIGEPVLCSFGMHGRTPVVRLPIPEPGGSETTTEFVIPHLLPSRDLLGQTSLLQTRLLEVAEATGAQVERLQAEAEFRFTIAPPLVVLVTILAAGVSLFWLAALVLPLALLAQGMDLSQKATEELFDALRARTQTPELEQITPIFERYRSFAFRLEEGLKVARWRPPMTGDAQLTGR